MSDNGSAANTALSANAENTGLRSNDSAATCDCGHVLGQHNHGGPCIECACPYFDDRDEQATDRSAATDSGQKKTYEPDPKPVSKPKKGK